MIKPNPTHTEGNKEVNFSVGFPVGLHSLLKILIIIGKSDTKFDARPYTSYHYWHELSDNHLITSQNLYLSMQVWHERVTQSLTMT